MQHRHLHPNEIDLLLDGEVGFGVAPLRAHIDECLSCRRRFERGRVIVDALERLPHVVPNARFADRVMADVQIVEPWYVAAIEFAKQLVPRSRPMRWVTAATASVLAVAMSVSAVWLVIRADAALYVFNLVADRGRAALVSVAGVFIGDTFGQAGLDALRSGSMVEVAIGAGVLLAAVGGATFGFRALTAAARRVRE
jgi:anti-sigma factor RsiW